MKMSRFQMSAQEREAIRTAAGTTKDETVRREIGVFFQKIRRRSARLPGMDDEGKFLPASDLRLAEKRPFLHVARVNVPVKIETDFPDSDAFRMG